MNLKLKLKSYKTKETKSEKRSYIIIKMLNVFQGALSF